MSSKNFLKKKKKIVLKNYWNLMFKTYHTNDDDEHNK